jgi:molybdopterin molybdotransferase
MISVQEAEKIVLSEHRDYGSEKLILTDAMGRILAKNIYADRDFPPFHRVTMDGIAIDYQGFASGIRRFKRVATQAAGVTPFEIKNAGECIEIMTGAVLPTTCDTIVRYEDLSVEGDFFILHIENITQGQNVHLQGRDKHKDDLVIAENQVVTPQLIQMAASVGATHLEVKKIPRVVIISSGDELVDIHETPLPYQIRRSNNYTLKTALFTYGIKADLLHIPDNEEVTKKNIKNCLLIYDVLILSGGISMGKFDYIPQALEAVGVQKLFHKVAQRPGKPFWFGKAINGAIVFALPGNPVSTFMCFQRYVLLWLEQNLGFEKAKNYAILGKNVTFKPDLHYFAQVKLSQNEQAQVVAMPFEGNGSGDFANLMATDAFIELPAGKTAFLEGEVYRIWRF